MSAITAYEKMLRNPANRISTSGQLKQPMPNESTIGAAGADLNNIPGKDMGPVDPEEAAYLASVDARMAARRAGQPINESTINLEKRVKDIEELLVEIMKTHTKLINKLSSPEK